MEKYQLNRIPVGKDQAKDAGEESEEKALDSSELKWEAILKTHLNGGNYEWLTYNASNCALCSRYIGVHKETDCSSCPLTRNGFLACEDSDDHSFSAWLQYHHATTENEKIEAAWTMLNRLRHCNGKEDLELDEVE